MKILYHHRTLGDGAEGIHITEMIKAFRELGHEVRVVCPSVASRSKNSTVAEVENNRLTARIKRLLPVSVFRLIEVFYNCVTYAKMSSAILRWKPDFIYERYCRSNFGGVLAARHFRVPHVLEVNTPYAVELKLYVGGTHHWLDQRLESFTFRKVDRIATVSTALKNYVTEQGVPAERVIVTPNAISPSVLPDVDKIGARRELGLPSDRLIIGFAGSMRKWHGIDFLLEAWPLIRSECPGDPFLLLVGDGELRTQVEQQIRQHGWEDGVRLVPTVPHSEIFRWMMAMDIGLMPDSNFYGSPMKVFEYMAMQTVACAPRLGPLEEIIENRKTGMLFQQRDLSSFVQAIRELADSSELRNRIAISSRQYVLTNHRWIDNANKVVKFAFESFAR
jgi:glycosyltransferase involved in cell wall biosynthesis